MTTNQPQPGWINRLFARMERDYQQWPDWMKRAYQERLKQAGFDAPLTPESENAEQK